MGNEKWPFRVHNLESDETKKFLRSILHQDTCIPFLGAGFTCGENAFSGDVPDGAKWMELMRKDISSATTEDKPTDEELEKLGFQDLSDIYFREKIVSLDSIKSNIKSHFTTVNITDSAKQRFLSINWPYIYTLNIDDGIERAINGVKVLPYKDFSRSPDCQYVYKLHGDAHDVLSAASHQDLCVIFGKADYINSLNKNKYLIASLVSDFCEKNIFFIGCSLSDELDISFALASAHNNNDESQTKKIFVTNNEPKSFTEKKKLKAYGITDVIVTDYCDFYNFCASTTQDNNKEPLEINNLKYNSTPKEKTEDMFLSYLMQSGWKQKYNPYNLSATRKAEKEAINLIQKEPLVVIWGRRFSGKTTILHRILFKEQSYKKFFIDSRTSLSDKVFNEIFRIKDALIAIDSSVLNRQQIFSLVQNTDTLRENNTTVILATSRADLSILGNSYTEKDVVEVESKFNKTEEEIINGFLNPLGLQRWNKLNSILDNVFDFGSSSIVNKILKNPSKLNEQIKSLCSENDEFNSISKLEFSLLFYLAIRQRMFSFVHNTLTKNYGKGYLETNIKDFAKKWAPFIEQEETDSISRRAENSSRVLVCNSFAWTQMAVKELSNKLGITKTAEFIVDLFVSVDKIDKKSHELILFDNLNSIYSSTGSKAIITTVYEKLAPYCAENPDFWIQRAKGIYYLSNNERELRIAIEYCQKSIVENMEKTRINVKLTKANLYGKLCEVTQFLNDDDLINAIDAYLDAIENRDVNSAYIDGLLMKNKKGRGYMSKVCVEATKKINLLPKIKEINTLTQWLSHN